MEVVRRLYHERILPAWLWLATVVGDFIEEAIFRLGLAFDVLRGRKPQQLERRWWSRSAETPVLIDVYDWTNERLIFSVLVWPSLETDAHDADHIYLQRVAEVREAIAAGVADKLWCTRFETDWGLRWNSKRECWVDSDGHAYDGARVYEYARGGGIPNG